MHFVYSNSDFIQPVAAVIYAVSCFIGLCYNGMFADLYSEGNEAGNGSVVATEGFGAVLQYVLESLEILLG